MGSTMLPQAKQCLKERPRKSGHAERSSASRLGDLAVCIALSDGAWQAGDERAALADCADRLQSAAVRVGDALGNRQPQPAAALRAIAPAIGAEEAIE